MSKFKTEKETEDYLVFSSRMLKMPDGSSRRVSAMKLIWVHYDFILNHPIFSQNDVMDYTLNMAETEKIDFDYAFENMVAYIGNGLRDILGIDK